MSLIGVTSYFTVSVVLFVIMLLSNIAAFFFIEQVGRRWILFYGMVILTAVELVCLDLLNHGNECTYHYSVDGYHGLCQNTGSSLGDPRQHLPVVSIVFTQLHEPRLRHQL